MSLLSTCPTGHGCLKSPRGTARTAPSPRGRDGQRGTAQGHRTRCHSPLALPSPCRHAPAALRLRSPAGPRQCGRGVTAIHSLGSALGGTGAGTERFGQAEPTAAPGWRCTCRGRASLRFCSWLSQGTEFGHDTGWLRGEECGQGWGAATAPVQPPVCAQRGEGPCSITSLRPCKQDVDSWGRGGETEARAVLKGWTSSCHPGAVCPGRWQRWWVCDRQPGAAAGGSFVRCAEHGGAERMRAPPQRGTGEAAPTRSPNRQRHRAGNGFSFPEFAGWCRSCCLLHATSCPFATAGAVVAPREASPACPGPGPGGVCSASPQAAETG